MPYDVIASVTIEFYENRRKIVAWVPLTIKVKEDGHLMGDGIGMGGSWNDHTDLH